MLGLMLGNTLRLLPAPVPGGASKRLKLDTAFFSQLCLLKAPLPLALKAQGLLM